MNKYKSVIFDLDGTLLNTLEDLTDGVNYALAQFKLPVRSQKEVRSYLGNGIRKLMECAVPENFNKESFEPVFECFRKYYNDHCQIKTGPYAGIMETLAKLKEQGYRMAIVSNKIDVAVEKLNEDFFQEYIEFAIGQNDKIKAKPAPDTVFQALKKLNCKPEDAIYVGDSEVDHATAVNSGMDCVLVSWGFRDKDFLETLNPDYLIDAPSGLFDCL